MLCPCSLVQDKVQLGFIFETSQIAGKSKIKTSQYKSTRDNKQINKGRSIVFFFIDWIIKAFLIAGDYENFHINYPLNELNVSSLQRLF